MSDRPYRAPGHGSGRPARLDTAGGHRSVDRTGRFRATARRIATQLDIEERMWRMLENAPRAE